MILSGADSRSKEHHKQKYILVSYQAVCECCGKEYTAHNKRSRFCSRKCKDVGYKRGKGQDSRLEPRHIVCTICGKEFDTFNPSKKTCSDECSKALKKEARWEKPYKPKEPLHKQCEICGETFDTYQNRQKICSKAECKKEHNRIANRQLKIRKRGQRQMVMRECKVCGTLFYCLDKEPNVTCSHECSEKWRKMRSDFRRDNRINKDNLVDYGITLEKIYARDNGICWICGGECDWNDYQMRDGIKICGRGYPSKDHVIPLTRGGKHSWENVRLAHLGCNIDKSDTTPTFTKEMSREQARKFAIERGFGKKKTAQYTLTGELVKVWESTAEIQREFGWSDSSIQSACRGEQRSSHGFVWRYVG